MVKNKLLLIFLDYILCVSFILTGISTILISVFLDFFEKYRTHYWYFVICLGFSTLISALFYVPLSIFLRNKNECLFHPKKAFCSDNKKKCIFKKRYLKQFLKEIFRSKMLLMIENDLEKAKKGVVGLKFVGGMKLKKIEELEGENEKKNKENLRCKEIMKNGENEKKLENFARKNKQISFDEEKPKNKISTKKEKNIEEKGKGKILIKEDKNQEENLNKCFVCLEKEVGSFFCPCQHTGVCKECTMLAILKAERCPKIEYFKCYVCKKKVDKVIFFTVEKDGKLSPSVPGDLENFLKIDGMALYDLCCEENQEN